MQKISKFTQKYLLSPLAISFWLPVIFMTGYFASRGMAPFGTSTILTVDLGQQYIDQFAAFKAAFLNHPSNFLYSFSNALGGDMLGEWAYYLMSPFNIIFLFVSDLHLPSAILWVTVFKFGAAGLSMAYLIHRLKLQEGHYISLFAISYPLSGWFIANDLNLLWLDTAILLPLLILALEGLLGGKKGWPYSILLALTIISNYYIAFMVVIFIVLYALWRFPQLAHKTIKIPLIFIGQSVLGAVMSAWLILPAYFQLQQGKIGHNSAWSLAFENNPLHLLIKLIPGSFDFEQMQNGQANIFISAFVLVALGAFVTNRTISYVSKLTALLLLAILILATCWAPLTLAFHGGQYPVWYPYRFSFLISFFLIFLAAWGYRPNWQPRLLTCSILFAIVTAITLYALSQLKQLSFLTNNNILIFWLLSSICLLVITAPMPHYLRLGLLGFITCISLTTNISTTLNNFSYINLSDYQTTITALKADKNKIHNDRSWYRVGQTYQRTRGDSMMEDFYGGGHFSSLMPNKMVQFYQAMGQPEGDNFVNYSNGTVLTDNLLGFKYYFSPSPQINKTEGSPQSRKTGYRADFTQYQRYAQTSTTTIFKNPQALPIAFAANQQVLQTYLNSALPIQNQARLWQALTGRKDQLISKDDFDFSQANNVNLPTTITNSQLEKKDSSQPGSLTLTFTPKTNDPYYLTLGGNLKIENFDLLINDQVITQFSSYRNTVIVNLTDHAAGQEQKLTIRLRNAASLTLSNVALYHLNQAAINQDVAQLKQHSLTITQRTENQISGHITTTTSKPVIMTSIPAAPGWQVKIDGKKVATSQVGNFLLAIKTKPGYHQVQFSYVPPYLYWGLIITLIGVIILGSQIIISRSSPRLQE
ncbi:YfhO family protein [Convivina intestini]|uniref:Putative membrane protein YfhO n=1 Tax=Convivina intestini TaxID=1505726 RepID=A0A2U1DCM1_9LACO|nr:YfhO family protein [Convivina intestini]PVY85434.1 putative membrane protein YfhO [Convivina intestini]CAH1853192.1 hypothetical protein R077811_00654 [Convivina intestini]SDB85162.1 Uncharacterized membrane protein YfhO [Leuconostocaceae bacterium R-53105]